MPTLGNLTFTTTAAKLRLRALMEVGMSDTEFLGGGTAEWSGDAQFLDLLNETESEVYSQHPALGVGSSPVTIAAGATSVPLPAGVWGWDVTRLTLQLPGHEGRVIDGVPPLTGEDLAPCAAHSEAVPRYFYFDEDRDSLVLSAAASTDLPVLVHYRVAPTTFTVVADAPPYSSIPTEYLRVPALLLASKMAFIMGDTERGAALLARHERDNAFMGDRLARMLAVDRRASWAVAGEPRTLLSRHRGHLIGAAPNGGRLGFWDYDGYSRGY